MKSACVPLYLQLHNPRQPVFTGTNLQYSIYNKEKYIVPNGGCNIGVEKRAMKPSGLCLFTYGGPILYL